MQFSWQTTALLLASFTFLTGFGEKHSKVVTQVKQLEKSIEFKFTVEPDPGHSISKDGPWTLQLSKTDGLNLELKNGNYENKNFDEKLPGFTLQAPWNPKAKSGKVDYTIRAFVCTNDKKHCYPQLHKGSVDWAVK